MEDLVLSTIIPVEKAQVCLRELIDQLTPGEEVVIIAGAQPIARLICPIPPPPRPAPGLGKGGIISMAPDFDDSIEDFGVSVG